VVKDEFYVVYFFWNQERIAQEFCVNKDVKELKCNGTCHLAKTLKAQKTEKKSLPKDFVESISELVVIKPDFQVDFLQNFNVEFKFPTYFALNRSTQKGFPIAVFHPPAV